MIKFCKITLLLIVTTLSSFSQQIDTLKFMPVDTLGQFYTGHTLPKSKFKAVTFIVPVVLVGYGFTAVYNHGALQNLDLNIKNEINYYHPNFVTKVDNYLQFAPAVAVYALNLSGIKGKHNLFDASILYATSTAIMGISTHIVKQGVGRMRPDLSENNSFPSGHTATAFAAAEFLHQEYKNVNPFIGYAGYLVATATGTLRMYNNKHWFSDVVAGAGFGIASTKIAYLVYPYMKSIFNKKKVVKISLMPYYHIGTKGIMLSGRL